MSEVPRERFVPPGLRRRAYRDGALRIAEGQTISQPWIVACMAQALELKGDERVLEVGTGSGYAAAVLSRLCRRGCDDRAIREPRGRGARTTWPSSATTTSRCATGDGRAGRPDRAPFEGISVTATAAGAPPAPLLEQLAQAARSSARWSAASRELLLRIRDGIEEALASVRFVPLVEGETLGAGQSRSPER